MGIGCHRAETCDVPSKTRPTNPWAKPTIPRQVLLLPRRERRRLQNAAIPRARLVVSRECRHSSGESIDKWSLLTGFGISDLRDPSPSQILGTSSRFSVDLLTVFSRIDFPPLLRKGGKWILDDDDRFPVGAQFTSDLVGSTSNVPATSLAS